MINNFDELTLYVSNGGDGSANVELCSNSWIANLLDEKQEEWGESSTLSLESLIKDIITPGQIFWEGLCEDRSESILQAVYEKYFKNKDIIIDNLNKKGIYTTFTINDHYVKIFNNDPNFGKEEIIEIIANFINNE